MSEVQLFIQELAELLKNNAQNPHLGTNLYPLTEELKRPDYAISFLQLEGLPLLLNLLKNGHRTVKEVTLTSFLNLICHYSVISAIVAKEKDHLVVDLDIFTTLIDCFMQTEEFGERKIIKESTSALTFFLQTLPNGFQLFRRAVASFPEEKDPYQSLVNNVVHSQLYQETLRLLQVIIRNSIMINATEPIDRLKKCGLVSSLESLRTTEDREITLYEADKILIDEILQPLGDACSRVGWYIEAIKRQPTKKIIEKVINSMGTSMSKRDIHRIADERLEDKLDEHLIEIRENIDQEFFRIEQELHSPKNAGSPDSVSRQHSASGPVTTMSTQTITSSGTVPCAHLCLNENCPETVCIFFRTLNDYLKTFFAALKIGGGAPIELEEIDQCIDLPGKAAKRTSVILMSTFRRSAKRERQEDQISFLIDVVSESTSQTLALRYYSALCNFTEVSDVKKLVECALWKIIRGLRETHSKSSCSAILKSITKQPQKYIQLFLSDVYGRNLPAAIRVCHPQDGDITANFFFKRNHSLENPGQDDVSDMDIPSFLNSNGMETKICSSNPDLSPPADMSPLERISHIDSKILETKKYISKLNATVNQLNQTVSRLKEELAAIKSSLE